VNADFAQRMGKIFIGNRITEKRASRSYGEMKNVFALPMREERIRGGKKEKKDRFEEYVSEANT